MAETIPKKEEEQNSTENSEHSSHSKNITKWVKYLIDQNKHQQNHIDELKKEIEEIKRKQEILGQSVLKIYEKDNK